MDNSANIFQADAEHESAPESRGSPRFTLLIRAAKLVTKQGEFVCVIRDVSESGISVRLFHALPDEPQIELQMPGGGRYEIQPVRTQANEAAFEFTQQVDVARLIHEASEYPKRGLRLEVYFPITITMAGQRYEGIIENLSQQGARFECEQLFAIDQSLMIEGAESSVGFREVRAKVRWRRDRHYGVVFDDTFTLGDFARLVARLQSPILLDD